MFSIDKIHRTEMAPMSLANKNAELAAIAEYCDPDLMSQGIQRVLKSLKLESA